MSHLPNMDLPLQPGMAYRFDGLYQWLHRKYRLALAHLTVAGHEFQIYKVANLDQLLDELAESPQTTDDDAPYWAELWPSALALAEFVIESAALKNRDVLEIGCGLGLCGLACHQAGANVMMSDLLPDAVRLAQLNWIVNFQSEPPVTTLDWRTPPEGQTAEIIVAADVLYEKQSFLPLLYCFETLLAPAGKIMLAEPNRPLAKEFFSLLQTRGFQYSITEWQVNNAGKPAQVSIYQIEKRR